MRLYGFTRITKQCRLKSNTPSKRNRSPERRAALGTLPDGPLPGLSQSDLLLPAAPAQWAEHDSDEVGFDGGGGAGCSDVRSAITTPV